MSLQHFFGEIKKLVADLESKPVIGTVVSDVVEAGEAAVNYIKTNGLTDLYKIATVLLVGAAAGTPWNALLAALLQQAEQAGLQVLKGSEAVVLAQAQADLIAAGKLLPPNAVAAA